jgi:porphobilinogen deaminase
MLMAELEKNQMFEIVSDILSKGQPNCNLKMFGQSSICISISGDDSRYHRNVLSIRHEDTVYQVVWRRYIVQLERHGKTSEDN